MRNPGQLAIFACCGIRNKTIVPTKLTFFTRNPRNFCKWNPLTFWNMFKYLSLESRNIQTETQNLAPIQCTVWPRNGKLRTFWKHEPNFLSKFFKLLLPDILSLKILPEFSGELFVIYRPESVELQNVFIPVGHIHHLLLGLIAHHVIDEIQAYLNAHTRLEVYTLFNFPTKFHRCF